MDQLNLESSIDTRFLTKAHIPHIISVVKTVVDDHKREGREGRVSRYKEAAKKLQAEGFYKDGARDKTKLTASQLSDFMDSAGYPIKRVVEEMSSIVVTPSEVAPIKEVVSIRTTTFKEKIISILNNTVTDDKTKVECIRLAVEWSS